MSEQPQPLGEDPNLNPLLKIVITVLQKLNEQILIFVIGVFVIALIAFVLGGQELIVQMRLLFFSLATVGIIAVVVVRFFPGSSTERRGGTTMPNLIAWLDKLNRVEFERMIHEILDTTEENRLSKPVGTIDTATFYNDMRFFDKLDLVQSYLEKNYMKRRPN